MDGEKLIQVSFQIPPSALDRLSRLAEQLRMLMEAAAAQASPGTRTAGEVREESGFFDPERFLALREGAELQPQAVRTETTAPDAARAVSADISHTADAEAASTPSVPVKDAEAVSSRISQAGNAEPVSAAVRQALSEAKSAGDTPRHRPEDAAAEAAATALQTPPLEERDIPLPSAEAARTGQPDEIPAVRAAADAAAIVPEAGRAVERQIPDARSPGAYTEERTLAPSAVRGGVSGGAAPPQNAAASVQARLETPQSRWSGAAEELALQGPAPLTAEAVSLAFERDGRRYDNGFPLY